MRKDFGPQNWLYPMPVLIVGSYDKNGDADVMTAAWGGIYDTNKLSICIDPGHKTAENILFTREFTVSIADAAHIVQCDYVGIVSAHDDPEKFEKSGFHAVKSSRINAPVIEELPMTLECRLLTFDEKTGCATADILNVSADEKILDNKGCISPAKLDPVCYDPVNHIYMKLGEAAGIAYQDGKKLK